MENETPPPVMKSSETSPSSGSGTGESYEKKDEQSTNKKKSILATRGTMQASPNDYKRGSSKAIIQWDERLVEKTHGEKLRFHRKSRLHALGLLMARGSKLSYIQEMLEKLKTEGAIMAKKSSQEEQQEVVAPSSFDSLVKELWYGMLNRTPGGEVELSLDQQVNLELLKHKIKADNDKYLQSHPELNIMLTLLYRKLLKDNPEDPKQFVANYVHHLNTHREELVLDEINVPFDPPLEPQQQVLEREISNETERIEVFARDLVQKCAAMASKGMAYVDVSDIIDTMLCTVSPSEDGISSESMKSAENVVSGILFSLLTSVANCRTRSAEIVAEEIMDSVVYKICPAVRKDSEHFKRIAGSVEEFIQQLLESLTEKAIK